MPRISVSVADSVESRVLAMDIWRAANAARPRPAGEVRAERVRQKIASADLLLLAHYGPRPAGMLLAEPYLADGAPQPDVAHLSMVLVDPALWGSRVGTTLIRDLQARPWTQVRVWTRTDNRRAFRLYLATGFADTGERSRLQDGDEIMQLSWASGV